MSLISGLPEGYEERTIDFARALLADIPEVSNAHYRVRYIHGAPVLVMAFDLPGVADVQAACFVRLVATSRSQPLRPAVLLEGDRLRRHVRDSLENYLAKHGICVPMFTPAMALRDTTSES